MRIHDKNIHHLVLGLMLRLFLASGFTVWASIGVGDKTPTSTEKKCSYLLGEANLEVARFGGEHPRTPVQDMANSLLRYSPAASTDLVQVAVPVSLEFNPEQQQQFGDGQRNALATYGPLMKSPFTAILTRKGQTSATSNMPSTLDIVLSQELAGFNQIKQVEVSVLGQTLKLLTRPEVS